VRSVVAVVHSVHPAILSDWQLDNRGERRSEHWLEAEEPSVLLERRHLHLVQGQLERHLLSALEHQLLSEHRVDKGTERISTMYTLSTENCCEQHSNTNIAGIVTIIRLGFLQYSRLGIA